MKRHFIPSVIFSLISFFLVSCSSNQGGSPVPANGAASAPQADPGGTVLVSAAASTKEVVETLADEFGKESKAAVTVNPGASSTLANQIVAGAPADLFLSANMEWADKVKEAGLSAQQVPLLTNKLVLIVPKGNPAHIKEPQDLASTEVKKLALAGENVPAGKYADQALERLGLRDGLINEGKVARGQDVRTALAYVERGEAEAGIVYATDVAAATNVVKVHEFDPKLHDKIVYVLVLLKQGEKNEAARKLYEHLQSPGADVIYQKFGFERLPGPSKP